MKNEKNIINSKNPYLSIDGINIGLDYPTYFIADIGANHDGSIDRAKELIYKCADAGANAAKFQHFQAKTIVSDYGFRNLDSSLMSHQSAWQKSVFEVYQDASIDLTWTDELKNTCLDAGITFLTTPYSMELVDEIDKYVSAYKIGSGDITWIEHLEYIAKKNKPVMLACGASTLDEIVDAVDSISKINSNIGILQCNTNYTANDKNFDYVNLKVLKTFSLMYPNFVLGLSDHTPGHASVLGAVSLGARIIEKHFTDDNNRDGPDHKFAMNPLSWKEMVSNTRLLERALGTSIKKIEDNELETVVIQRRCLRAKTNLKIGHTLTKDDIVALRPSPKNSISPKNTKDLIGKKLKSPIKNGDLFKWELLK